MGSTRCKCVSSIRISPIKDLSLSWLRFTTLAVAPISLDGATDGDCIPQIPSHYLKGRCAFVARVKGLLSRLRLGLLLTSKYNLELGRPRRNGWGRVWKRCCMASEAPFPVQGWS